MSRQNDELSARYDEAVYELAIGQNDSCIEKLRALLTEAPDYFDAQLALGTAFLRKGDYPSALAEAHKAEALQPDNQMAQMNLSMIYVRMGQKEKAEQHALKAKLAYWKKAGKEPPPFLQQSVQKDLQLLAQTPPQPLVFSKKKSDLPQEQG